MNWLSDAASNFGGLFDVGSTVSSSTNINPDDVVKTKSALKVVGNYKVPSFGITDIPDNQMIDGLKSFQQENGLKVDGVMKPSGPTATALGQTLASKGVTNTDLMETAKKAKPKPKAKVDLLTGLPDPLAKPVKGKMPTAKQWEEASKLQQQKLKNAIVPEGKTVQQRIQSMMTDKRYGDQHDTRLRDHVTKQFEKAFPGTLQYDETGKMVQPVAAISPDQVEPFDPGGEFNATNQKKSSELSISKKPDASQMFKLNGGVGPNEQNAQKDKIKVRNLLALLGQTGLETSSNDEETISGAVKRFQEGHGLKVDGVLKPGGETITQMEDSVKRIAEKFAKGKKASSGVSKSNVFDDNDEPEYEDDLNDDDTPWWMALYYWFINAVSPDEELGKPYGGGTRH